MLHHLPGAARRACAREIRRVLRPGGRVLVVDFGPAPRGRRSLIGHLHRHGHLALRDIVALLGDAGLDVLESGAVGTRSLHYALAGRPAGQ
jgi:ubiquinone/menaquinone biosynthesis C-methylase UbiE